MMMKTIKSFILGAMALAMVAPVFTACGDDDTKTETVEKIIYSLKSEYSYNDSIVAAQKAKSKKDVAVLLVAFGSTWNNAFQAFDATKAAYESAFPNADVYVCFSSDICINRASAGENTDDEGNIVKRDYYEPRYLLHAIGGGMDEFNRRYVDNGMMDYLMKEREAGRIRNLGFSFHGKQEVFDEVLALHDQYHWDFVQIELNYLDWDYANEISKSNVDASYLYAELQKKGIPAVIMEPLLGGRLANLQNYLAAELKSHAPERSVASWAFRYAGTPEGVLTVLSGMTYMEHLKDNLLSYCPLVPLSKQEQEYLHKKVADRIVGLENIPCNDCKYCMPCPYGIDIPTIFVHYNKCKNEGTLPRENVDKEYAKLRRNYLIGLDRAVPRLRQADHCIGCGQCEPHCPQSIRIPRELRKISEFVEELRRSQEA